MKPRERNRERCRIVCGTLAVWGVLLLAGSVAGGQTGTAASGAPHPVVSTEDELQTLIGHIVARAFPETPPSWECSRNHDFGAEGQKGYELLPPDNLGGGRNWFQLRESSPGSKNYLLPVDLFWEDSVWVAARPLRARQILGAVDLVRRVTQHTQLPAEVAFAEAPVGMCLDRAMTSGEVFTRSNLKPAPLIERGAIVRLVYRRPGLTVASRAEALESGSAGEAIRVRPLDVRRVCRAIVVSSGEVEVLMP